MAYDRMIKWIEKNKKPSQYKTYEDFIDSVTKERNIDLAGSKARRAIDKAFRTEFKFESDNDLKKYISMEQKKIKELQSKIKALQEAKSQADIEKIITETPKIETPKPEPTPRREGFFTRSFKRVGGFLDRLFRR